MRNERIEDDAANLPLIAIDVVDEKESSIIDQPIIKNKNVIYILFLVGSKRIDFPRLFFFQVKMFHYVLRSKEQR